ncbi:sigma-54 dependent DNA-binding response regulator [Lachnospiraceae bacterium TWA4]|nr:sigma-54 dependent DNA-binding response regulator [Lachnospiraceae bacterium TWA4]
MNSGPDSITYTFDEIIKFFNHCTHLAQQNDLLKQALKVHPAITIIIKQDGTLTYSSHHAVDIQDIIQYVQALTDSPDTLENSKSFHYIKDVLYSISVNIQTFEDINYYIFCVEATPVPQGSSKHGLRYSNLPNVRHSYKNSIFSLTAIASSLDTRITQLNQSNQPIMILGERGTAKNVVAERLYMESDMNHAPFIQIDCVLINNKMWDFLLKHYNSPFFDLGNTIYISNIQALEPTRRQLLLSMFLDTKAHKRNRIIFSCSQTLVDPDENPSRNFIDYLPCSTLYLPPLREFPEDIIAASTLYLHHLNRQSLKQILGFDAEATQLLTNYQWPDNFFQLKRVITELSLLADTPYISKELVKEILDKEAIQYVATFRSDTLFDYDRPLNEIVQEIVEVVLARCNGNQTKAAKQLGIGRTTLWRYLNPGTKKIPYK